MQRDGGKKKRVQCDTYNIPVAFLTPFYNNSWGTAVAVVALFFRFTIFVTMVDEASRSQPLRPRFLQPLYF